MKMWKDVDMKPRRILIFSLGYYPRFVGGAEVAIKEITDRIPHSEMEFDMITLQYDRYLPRHEKIGNINVHRIGWTAKREVTPQTLPWYIALNKYAYLINALVAARHLHRKHHYDAIWSLMATYNTFAALFFKLSNPAVKFIFSLQDGDPISYLKHRALPLYPFFKMFFTRADKIQAISHYLADWASDMGARCPVTVVPNAVDFTLFSAKVPDEDLQELKSRLKKSSDDTFLITVSRLVRKNAISDIISALAYLPRNIKLLILGDGPLASVLKYQASELKVSDRIQFLGHISHDHMPPYLQISDIFVRPSLSEGLGNSFLEAMAAGLPVIGTNVGGIPDFLKDGETGLFVEVNNPKNLAQKIEKLIKDRESKEYVVRQAQELVRDNYQWPVVAEKMKHILAD